MPQLVFLLPLVGVMLYLRHPIGLLVFLGALTLSIYIFRVYGRGVKGRPRRSLPGYILGIGITVATTIFVATHIGADLGCRFCGDPGPNCWQCFLMGPLLAPPIALLGWLIFLGCWVHQGRRLR